MERKRSERGSALLLSMVVALMVLAIGGSFMAETLYRGQTQAASIQSDEAQMLLDAVLEKGRRALYQYRTDGGGDATAWNNILAYCREKEGSLGGTLRTTSNGGQATTVVADGQNWVTDSAGNVLNLPTTNDPSRIKTEYKAAYASSSSSFASYKVGAAGANSTGSWTTDYKELFLRHLPYSEGGFYLTFIDNDDGDGNPAADVDNRGLIVATMTFPDGTQRQIEALIEYVTSNYDPDAAVLTEGTIDISGNPTVKGLKGSVHANAHLHVGGGSAVIEKNITATGFTDIHAGTSVGGEQGGGKTEKAVPSVNPETYRSKATYIMTGDGSVIDNATGATIFTASSSTGGGPRGTSDEFNSWKFTGSSGWDLSSNTAPAAATYFFEADVKISGNPGEKGTAAQMTVITTHDMTVSGNPSIVPFLADVGFITGGDLEISGNPGAGVTNYQGFYAAHEQIKISGNPTINGAVLAEDNGSASDAIRPTEINIGKDVNKTPVAVSVSGNPTITFNGGLKTLLGMPGAAPILSQRRLK